MGGGGGRALLRFDTLKSTVSAFYYGVFNVIVIVCLMRDHLIWVAAKE